MERVRETGGTPALHGRSELAKLHRIEMPMVEETYGILCEGKEPSTATGNPCALNGTSSVLIDI